MPSGVGSGDIGQHDDSGVGKIFGGEPIPTDDSTGDPRLLVCGGRECCVSEEGFRAGCIGVRGAVDEQHIKGFDGGDDDFAAVVGGQDIGVEHNGEVVRPGRWKSIVELHGGLPVGGDAEDSRVVGEALAVDFQAHPPARRGRIAMSGDGCANRHGQSQRQE